MLKALRTSATLLLGLLAAGPAWAGGPYAVAGTASSTVGPLTRTETLVTNGPGPLDRFKAVRLARTGPAPFHGSLLLLPPLGPSFPFYEQRDANGALGSSISEFFALRGYDVWSYGLRMDGIPSGTCEAGVVDCSPMEGWNFDLMVEDITFLRGLIEAARPGGGVVVGGTSLGAMLTIAVANAHPADYDGAVVWEGSLLSDDSAVQTLNQGYCAAIEAQIAGGFTIDGVGTSVFREIARQAGIAPQGLTTIPLFPPFLTNHQLFVTLLSTPQPGPVSGPLPGYIQLAGDPVADQLTFADDARVIANVGFFVNYVPNIMVRDVSCALGGVDTHHTTNLGAFTAPVLAIGGGRGFGPAIDDVLTRFGSTDVTLLIEPDFGHVDHFFTLEHRTFVERPILKFLRRAL
ncbi:MAG TPA: hypothetical protein VF017_24060 [Thermoanaerobaculia bacterium]|nr:hypothetical protein [Thermoanaerobaculia bacterium]